MVVGDMLKALMGDDGQPNSGPTPLSTWLPRGMGVRTKTVALLVKQNGVPPEFEATDDYFVVRMSVRMCRGPASRRLSNASHAIA